MEIKAELLYPYTQEEKESFIINQNHRLGCKIREVERTVEYEEKVLEFEEVEEERPIYNEEGEIIGYETVIVKKPIMITVEEEIQVPIYDEETGEIIGYETQIVEKEIQKFHYETREMVVIDLQAWGLTEEEQEQQKRERIAMLNLTRGDVFEGLIKARMMDESFIMAMIEQMPEETQEEKLAKMLAKNACANALNFHRGHALVDVIGGLLGISSENLDLFFETKDYHYLEEIQPEPVEETILDEVEE